VPFDLAADLDGHLVVCNAGDASRLFFNLQAEASSELVTTFPFLSAPSGVVPGDGEDGRGSSLQCSGGSRGPDCFYQFSVRVFSVSCRDLVVFHFSAKVRFVKCTCTADNFFR
jgi:hypothetical protein